MPEVIQTVISAFFDPHFVESMGRILTAIACGLIVGMERTYRGKPAGIRTNLLICMGACMFMIVSAEVAHQALRDGYTNPDPARIAAQVVSGIGFLGAGTIMHNRGLVSGLTSAASIWVIAAIGLLCGTGLLKLAFFTTIIIVLVLEFFGFLIKYIRVERFRYMSLEVVMKKESSVPNIRKTLRNLNITYAQESTENIMGELNYRATIYFRGPKEQDIEDSLILLKGVRHVILMDQGVE